MLLMLLLTGCSIVQDQSTEQKPVAQTQKKEGKTMTADNIPHLKDVYKDYFYIGAAISPAALASVPDRELIAQQFNSLTAENALKFQSVHPQEGVYTFEQADQIVEFAQQNGMRMIGHTLIWHQQTPDWVFQDDKGTWSAGMCSSPG